jgi:hypothetical protein
VPAPGCREVEPPLAPVPRLLRAAAEGRKFFKTNVAVSRCPTHDPAKALNAEVTGQSTVGTSVTVGMTEGGLAVITTASAQKQRANRQSNFGPTCRLVPSPEAGLGATVDTLNQAYPYYSMKTRCLCSYLWPRGEQRPTPPRGRPQGRHVTRRGDILQDAISGSGPPRESTGPLYTQPGPSSTVRDSQVSKPDPLDGD